MGQPVAPLSQTTLDLPLGPSSLSGDGTTLAAYIPRKGSLCGAWVITTRRDSANPCLHGRVEAGHQSQR